MKVESGEWDVIDNLLYNVLYMLVDICDSDWNCSYDCMLVVYLVLEVYRNKFWLMVNCIDDVYGDWNLICFCFSIESYVEE